MANDIARQRPKSPPNSRQRHISPLAARTKELHVNQQPPNILMIVTDQERYDILGCNGSAICETPNLDQLASSGVRFDHAFTPTALCSPARGSLLTGLYPHSHGVLNNMHDEPAITTELDVNHATSAKSLRSAGYRLGYVGKWHLGRVLGPDRHHFHDDFSAAYDIALAESDRPLKDVHEAMVGRAPMQIAGVDPRPIVDTDTYSVTESGIKLLHTYSDLDKPFMLRVDYEGPHHPYMPPEPFASRYNPADIPAWENFLDNDPGKPAAHARLLRQRGVQGMTWDQWQPIIALYYGFMTFIDAEIGRLLNALEDGGLADNTVVIHTTDHGDMTGSHGGQFNKGPIMYDELYRVPLIIRDPRLSSAGHTCPAMVSTVDLMPTIVELAGVDVPDGVEGSSLVPFLGDTDLDDPARTSVFGEYHGGEWGLYSQRMVRTRTAKLVYSPHGTDELYDLVADPHELTNLIDIEASQPLLTELETLLVEWMRRTKDPLYGWAARILPSEALH